MNEEMEQMRQEIVASRKEQAKELALLLGSEDVLNKLQAFIYPEVNPAVSMKGQIEPLNKIKTEGGFPFDYIGMQFVAHMEAKDKLVQAIKDIRSELNREEKDTKKPLRK